MQRRFHISIVAVLAVWPVLLALASPGKEYTEVRLMVTDDKGAPVPKAAITLNFIRGKNMFGKKDRAQWDVKTDSKGVATVPYIPHGKLKVQVFAKGYQTYGEEFDISGDEQTIPVKLLPPQDQYSAHEAPAPKKP